MNFVIESNCPACGGVTKDGIIGITECSNCGGTGRVIERIDRDELNLAAASDLRELARRVESFSGRIQNLEEEVEALEALLKIRSAEPAPAEPEPPPAAPEPAPAAPEPAPDSQESPNHLGDIGDLEFFLRPDGIIEIRGAEYTDTAPASTFYEIVARLSGCLVWRAATNEGTRP